jgi:hypothetical protein
MLVELVELRFVGNYSLFSRLVPLTQAPNEPKPPALWSRIEF